jgi:DHA2 family multidrug resistance protein
LPAPAGAGASAAIPEKASLTTWIAILAGMIGAFMAILNIQITNASLLDIEGGIGTGVDNGAWISTSYLIGEIVVIPLTSYLSRVFSFRTYMIASTLFFALFSMACAFAQNLGQMIAMRGLQGFAGGVLIPMAFTMVATRLPKAQQPTGLAMFALAVTLLAPANRPDHRRLPHREDVRLADDLLHQPVQPDDDRGALLHAGACADAVRPAQEGDWAGIVTMAIWPVGPADPARKRATRTDWFSPPSSWLLVAVVFSAHFTGSSSPGRSPRRPAAACEPQFRHRHLANVWSASPCSASSTSCRNISGRCRATTPSRSAACWPGPACRNCCSSRWSR